MTSYPERLFIADIAGPAGSLDALGDWCKAKARSLAGASGLARIARYRKLNDVRTLVVAEITDERATPMLEEAFASPAPYTAQTLMLTQKAERRRADASGDPRELPLFYTVGFPAPPDKIADLAAWYDDEHAPMLQKCPYWVMTRRFQVDGPLTESYGTHLAVHYLSDIRALRSPERDEARRTPWRNRLAAQGWFRGVYAVCLQEN